MGDREDRELAGTKDKSSSVYQRANAFLKVEPCDLYCASGSSGSQSPKGMDCTQEDLVGVFSSGIPAFLGMAGTRSELCFQLCLG